MALEYRSPTEETLRATLEAGSVAFAEELRDVDFDLFRPEIPADRVFGAYDGDTPVGITASIAFEMTIPGGLAPCAGITWVGVMPTHRRRGVLTGLMRQQLDDLRTRGEPLGGALGVRAGDLRPLRLWHRGARRRHGGRARRLRVP